MARTDANPPMPEFPTDYVLQEVDADYLTKAVKPKQFLHIDQAECILCEGCVDICPWKCIHMLSTDAIDEAVNADQPGEDPKDHVFFVVDEDVCTRCALCVDRCPTGVIILGKTGVARRRRPPPAHQPTRLRLRRAVLEVRGDRFVARTTQRQARERRPPGRRARWPKVDEKVRGSQAWTSIFRPGSVFRKGLHRQPPQPLLRDHEQRAVPPSPGEGEAARGEGLLHAVPRRPVLLPLHPADGHRHLPDVLLPADRGPGVERHLHALQTSVTFGLLVRNMHRWAAHLMVLTVFLHMAGSSTTAPTSRPASSTG